MITVAGISIHKGKPKVRFCSDFVLRIKNLQRQGDTDIRLVELPHPMSKPEACNYMLSSGLFKDYEDVISNVLGKKHLPKILKAAIIKPVVEQDKELEEIQALITT